ncbi:hypothetical protein VF13_42305 [Nostoc linckia z16]|nr:hypothetical protein VF13_42305 [Nostoc linckia z16]
MNTKQLLLAGVFLLGGATYAQQIQTNNTTGLGVNNGAVTFTTATQGNNSTYLGAESGAYADPTTTGGNTFVGTRSGRGNATGAKNTGILNTFIGFESGFNITSGSRNAFFGNTAGRSTTEGINNTYIGSEAGYSNTTGASNTYLGQKAGNLNTAGGSNVFVGAEAGSISTAGSFKICIGHYAGIANNSDANVFIGHGSGSNNVNGYSNTFIGHLSGNNGSGSNNVFLGQGAGQSASGDGNVFIGPGAGYGANMSGKLLISTSATPLVYGDFLSGKVGIGGLTTFPATAGSVSVANYRLFVKGGILTEEARIQLQSGWADYVFAKDYKLPSLTEVEQFIAINGHLPNVPSAAEVKADGIELGNMARIQQEKIEELTLYAIAQDKKIDQQQKEIDELKAAVKMLLADKK